MSRTIVHLDLDTFFVSVERLMNSKLEDKPLIIGGTGDRGVVSSCSYEARVYGVHAGMPMRMARQLCGDAVYIRGDMDQYTKYSRLVTDIIADSAPVYEKASIDEHYLDITGMDRFFGSMKWSQELRQKIISESGLPISFGMSVNKTVAKIATGEAKPAGELHVDDTNVHNFLDPLSIKKIPMLGKVASQKLQRMGVDKILTLRQMPVEMLQNVMGKNGVSLWKKANGLDSTPVFQYSERKSISAERTFQQDSIDVKRLNELIVGMAEKLAYSLRKKRKLCSVITVKIRYSNFDTYTMQKRISYTSFDHVIMEVAKELFVKLYTRRMLVRLIGVKLSGLIEGVQQLDLFNDAEEMVNLYKAMDNIRNKYGSKAVRRGIAY
ncbi:MAG: DNA polymerase IV [Bacteroidetes bacterium 4572_112]|nr:MAG: DNA polymerase IV [Bacteroidetes bacterium 4572_112]